MRQVPACGVGPRNVAVDAFPPPRSPSGLFAPDTRCAPTVPGRYGVLCSMPAPSVSEKALLLAYGKGWVAAGHICLAFVAAVVTTDSNVTDALDDPAADRDTDIGSGASASLSVPSGEMRLITSPASAPPASRLSGDSAANRSSTASSRWRCRRQRCLAILVMASASSMRRSASQIAFLRRRGDGGESIAAAKHATHMHRAIRKRRTLQRFDGLERDPSR
jgi:hypothetical protein